MVLWRLPLLKVASSNPFESLQRLHLCPNEMWSNTDAGAPYNLCIYSKLSFKKHRKGGMANPKYFQEKSDCYIFSASSPASLIAMTG